MGFNASIASVNMKGISMSKRMGQKARRARKASIEKRAASQPVLQVVDRTGRAVQVTESKPVRLPDFNVKLKRDKGTGKVAPTVEVVRARKSVNLGLGASSPAHHGAIMGRTYHATAWNAPTGEGRTGRAKAPTKGRWSRD